MKSDSVLLACAAERVGERRPHTRVQFEVALC